jgi:hypothetical protein
LRTDAIAIPILQSSNEESSDNATPRHSTAAKAKQSADQFFGWA